MPHSNDRTLVTAAGDGDVRIFDLEHSAQSSVPSTSSRLRSDRAQGFMNNGVRYMSEHDAQVKVFRSHSDRVKRIVTESSPFLFLSCSEDGEVRQWDIRQPESTYPRPAGVELPGEVGDPPPALISYKRKRLDLNTISCSPSQPHYIALGGAHLHCFIHDRRMLGRDKTLERGSRAGLAASSGSGYSDHEENLISEATQCVKRLAPQGLRTPKQNEHGHITACKISDANPNEMVASWSGDWIYSFDILRSPDARDLPEKKWQPERQARSGKVQQSSDRKRKRKPAGSSTSLEGSKRAGSKPRTTQEKDEGAADTSLRVRYQNGQSEDIPLLSCQSPTKEESPDPISIDDLTSYRIANTSVRIRKEIFTLPDAKETTEQDPTGHASSFTSVLGFCASILDDMDEIMRSWRYPVSPERIDTVLQNTLRENRQKSRRFVQASGTLSRVLGGKLRTTSGSQQDMLAPFVQVSPAPGESSISDVSEQFCYDFLKAICLWLDSGPGALVEGFTKKSSQYRTRFRHPIPDGSSVDTVDGVLIPYILRLASGRSVPNVDASRFEIDANRIVFDTEVAAVRAFAQAIRIPFADLSSATAPAQQPESNGIGLTNVEAQDRQTAVRFWGLKVGRGVLLNAGEGVNHAFVDQAFGGMGKTSRETKIQEDELERRLENIDSTESEDEVRSVRVARNSSQTQPRVEDTEDSDEEMVAVDDVREAMADAEDDDGMDDSGSERGDDADADEDDDEDREERNGNEPELYFNHVLRQRQRRKVNQHIPCIGGDRCYEGAANVRTVKDVNFFGLQDEYVVSGSDCGNFFIWDRRTTERVNILEGDGEVVNVIQGHPYEPMLAVSGIDNTIKIFSPDKRARQAARKGEGVTAADSSGFSSLRYGGRVRFGANARRPAQRRAEEEARQKKEASGNPDEALAEAWAAESEPAFPNGDVDDSDAEEAQLAPNGLASRRRMHREYEIVSQNDETRQSGNNEAFVSRGMLMAMLRRMGLGRMRRRRPPDGDGADDGEGEDDGDDDEGGLEREMVMLGEPDHCEVSPTCC